MTNTTPENTMNPVLITNNQNKNEGAELFMHRTIPVIEPAKCIKVVMRLVTSKM
jgi:hypothetical protein